ncbi:MAG: 3-deoxy-D-manno-octulosonic acid transferase [Elusimicrobiota bacterium]
MSLLLYQIVFPLIGLMILARMLLAGRGGAIREGAPDIRQRLGLLSPEERARLGDGPVAWFHAASVGEVRAAAPLLRMLAAAADRPRILVTTSTVSGREHARKLPEVDLAVLAPMDFFPAVSAFLRRARPRSLVLIETELWPMTLWAARRRGIRLGIANGRITERAFSRYRWIRGIMARLLSGFERAAVQTGADAERYKALGLPPAATKRTGNLKYDQQLPSEEAVAKARERLAGLGWAEDPCWVAGSTRRGEEAIVLEAHKKAVREIPRLRLILAPRHPERSQEVESLLRAGGLRCVRWSQLLPFQADPECILIDALGVLGSLYPVGRAAFVGGTLVPVGGHNLLEPALAGVPVLFGPHTASVRKVAQELERSGGGRVAQDAAGLATALTDLLLNESDRRVAGTRARRAAMRFSGATERTFEHLRPLLLPEKMV